MSGTKVNTVNFYLKNKEVGFTHREATQTLERNVDGGQCRAQLGGVSEGRKSDKRLPGGALKPNEYGGLVVGLEFLSKTFLLS